MQMVSYQKRHGTHEPHNLEISLFDYPLNDNGILAPNLIEQVMYLIDLVWVQSYLSDSI